MGVRKVHFEAAAPSGDAPVEKLYADNLPEGGKDYTLPAATESALGGVKMAAAVADAAEGADAAALRTTVNALLASLRASNALAS